MVTRASILKKAKEMANHNLYCVSDDYAMSRPKAGMEAEHAEYAAESDLLRDWLAELTDSDPVAKFERDLQDAKDGTCEGEIITARREEIARLQRELAQIEEAAS